MTVRKTSKAKIFTARLNPINPEEKTALTYIAANIEKGYNFKDIIVDAINARAGITPEMFAQNPANNNQQLVGQMERIFGEFAEQLMAQISSGAIRPAADDNEPAEMSKFTRTFMDSLRQRQQQSIEEVEDD